MSLRTLDVWVQWSPLDERRVGTLAHRGDGYRFEFAASWLAEGVELSPRLGRVAGLRGPWPVLPGLFAGSLPDQWGRFVMDRRARAAGLVFQSDLDRLAYLGDHTAGALVYRPPLQDAPSKTTAVKLRELVAETAHMLEGEVDNLARQIALAGSSMGGTRPKYTIAIRDNRYYVGPPPDGAALWLVKLPAASDPKDIGAIEYVYMSMARQAGIAVPELKLFDRTLFGIKRFDREGLQRRHVLTFADMFDMGDLVNTYATSYEDLIRTTWQFAGVRAAGEMLRRMVFNILVNNRDDHVRNHAFLCDPAGRWTLSPAYDLTFAEGPNGWHSLVIGEGANPTLADVQALAARLELKGVNEMIEAVGMAVSAWPKLAKAAGIKVARIKEISKRQDSIARHFRGRD